MKICEAEPRTDARGARFLALDALAWTEVFVLIGFQFFWVVCRSTPILTEHGQNYALAAVPYVIFLAAGLLALRKSFSAALRRLEWLFHLSAALCQLLLLVLLALHDPFDMRVPLSAFACLWVIGLGFILLAGVAGHERRATMAYPSTGSTPIWISGFSLVAAWIVLVGLLASMSWLPFVWLASTLLHAIMAPCVRRAMSDANANRPRPRTLGRTIPLLESLALVLLILFAMIQIMYVHAQRGSTELKYAGVVALFASPLFAAGVLTAFFTRRFRVPLLAHGILVAIVVAWPEATRPFLGFLLGYAVTALWYSTARSNAAGYALAAASIPATWTLGLLAYTLSFLITSGEHGGGVDKMLILTARIGMPVCLALAVALAALFNRSAKDKDVPASETTARRGSAIGDAVLYVVLSIALAGLVGAVAVSTFSPGLRMKREAQVHVGEPCGVCHAGYSQTDEEYALLDSLGVSLMRVDFHWRGVQPAPGTWTWDRWDGYMDAAERNGTRVLALLVFDNDAVETSEAGKAGGKYIAPEDVPLFLEYVKRIVSRYRGRVYAWEIWNEPDQRPRFWDGPMDEFYDLARQTAAAVRQVAPDVRLVGTAMASPFGAIVPKDAIQGLHESGALKMVDHPSLHVYLSNPIDYYNVYARVIAAARKHGHPGSHWITELGDPDGGAYPWRASSELLADHVIKSHVIATSYGIEMLVWYCLRDSTLKSQRAKPGESEYFFGLLGPDDQWKPAAYAYRLFSKRCSNSVIRSDLVDESGGLAARALRSTLYRKEDGESALVLWYESRLCPGGTARVELDLGPLKEPAIVHDLDSAYTKELLDDYVYVGNRPVFITFHPGDAETPVHLQASALPYDYLMLLAGASAVVIGLCAAVSRRRCS
ncbi:MAG: hypothetical protein GWP08_10175 [Nitrospiraceae bacterium]|nr:hypothetical protein [Nitrospiraceae bacterium]